MTDGSVVLAILRLLVSLGVVLVLLVALARWASRRGLGSGRPGKATVDVDVLTRRSLGRNSTLQVVKVGSQVMVLGVTERGVNVLGELGDEDLVTPTTPLTVVPSIGPSTPPAPSSPLSTFLPAAARKLLGTPAPRAVIGTAAATPATTPQVEVAPAPVALAPVAPAPVAPAPVAPAPAPLSLVSSAPVAAAEPAAPVFTSRAAVRAAREAAAAAAADAAPVTRPVVTPIADPSTAATPEAAAFLAALASAPALNDAGAPFVWPDEDVASVAADSIAAAPTAASPTYAIAESRALARAGYAVPTLSFAEALTESLASAPTEPVAQPVAQPVVQPQPESRAAVREARRGTTARSTTTRAAKSRTAKSRTAKTRGTTAAPTQPRQSRTIVPVDSRSARRAQQRTAEVPTGWPWNAAALVLSVGRGRRG